MRLFIAINFDDETKNRIANVQGRLKAYGRGNFTKRENMHLTLAFLGELPETDLDTLKSVMDNIKVPDMKLEFSRVGCFRRDSELWWIGIKENKALSDMQKALITLLKEAGFKPDTKKFKPHITLARQMHVGMIDSGELLERTFYADVNHISLMLSERKDGRLVYTELYRR